MRSLRLWVIFILLSTCTAGAVSRVGGGKVKSHYSGFEMTLPPDYNRVEDLGSQGVVAKGPFAFQGARGYLELYLRVAEFMQDFPDAKDLNMDELEKRLTHAEWESFNITHPCIRGFRNDKGNLISYIATWGSGKGFVINGPKLNSVDKSISQMISTLKVDPGGCSWK